MIYYICSVNQLFTAGTTNFRHILNNMKTLDLEKKIIPIGYVPKHVNDVKENEVVAPREEWINDEFRRLLHEAGKVWTDDDLYTNENRAWDKYDKHCAYRVSIGTYGAISFYTKEGCTILEGIHFMPVNVLLEHGFVMEEAKVRYRFKTEEEFKKEFGDNWRSIVDWTRSGSMDHLIGKEVTEAFYQKVQSTDQYNHMKNTDIVCPNLDKDNSWRVSNSMLTVDNPNVVEQANENAVLPEFEGVEVGLKYGDDVEVSDSGIDWNGDRKYIGGNYACMNDAFENGAAAITTFRWKFIRKPQVPQVKTVSISEAEQLLREKGTEVTITNPQDNA